jgi:hypothetical protein
VPLHQRTDKFVRLFLLRLILCDTSPLNNSLINNRFILRSFSAIVPTAQFVQRQMAWEVDRDLS